MTRSTIIQLNVKMKTLYWNKFERTTRYIYIIYLYQYIYIIYILSERFIVSSLI